MDIFLLQEKIDDLIDQYLDSDKVVTVTPEQLGLDDRCYGLSVHSQDEVLIVHSKADRNLQYYGGFEYAKDARIQLGDYVFYSADASSRVRECLDRLQEEINLD